MSFVTVFFNIVRMIIFLFNPYLKGIQVSSETFTFSLFYKWHQEIAQKLNSLSKQPSLPMRSMPLVIRRTYKYDWTDILKDLFKVVRCAVSHFIVV
jgi:membrane associated rhomboid family serine protease